MKINGKNRKQQKQFIQVMYLNIFIMFLSFLVFSSSFLVQKQQIFNYCSYNISMKVTKQIQIQNKTKDIDQDRQQKPKIFNISRSKSLGKLMNINKDLKKTIQEIPHLDLSELKRQSSYISSLLHSTRDKVKSSLEEDTEKCFYNNEFTNNQCSCGRHLSKINSVRAEMNRGNSVYQNNFYGKSSIEVEKVVPKQTDRLKGDHLDMRTIYANQFKNPLGNSVQKHKPKDALKFEGPRTSITTYANLFLNHKGSNQYIKPTDNIIKAEAPFNSKSTYEASFPQKTSSNLKFKLHDNLKIGASWIGASTYRSVYQKPNPESYLPIIRISEKLNLNHPDAHQFETSYRNDFIQKSSSICPAKVRMQKNELNQALTKSTFKENSDFKAMSRDFHAISTSKLSNF